MVDVDELDVVGERRAAQHALEVVGRHSAAEVSVGLRIRFVLGGFGAHALKEVVVYEEVRQRLDEGADLGRSEVEAGGFGAGSIPPRAVFRV